MRKPLFKLGRSVDQNWNGHQNARWFM